MATTDGCTPVNSSGNSTFLWLRFCSDVTETGPTPFLPSDESEDLVSRTVLEAVENVLFIGVLPVLVTVGVITNVINMVIFARQGLADRINMCLFR